MRNDVYLIVGGAVHDNCCQVEVGQLAAGHG